MYNVDMKIHCTRSYSVDLKFYANVEVKFSWIFMPSSFCERQVIDNNAVGGIFYSPLHDAVLRTYIMNAILGFMLE